MMPKKKPAVTSRRSASKTAVAGDGAGGGEHAGDESAHDHGSAIKVKIEIIFIALMLMNRDYSI